MIRNTACQISSKRDPIRLRPACLRARSIQMQRSWHSRAHVPRRDGYRPPAPSQFLRRVCCLPRRLSPSAAGCSACRDQDKPGTGSEASRVFTRSAAKIFAATSRHPQDFFCMEMRAMDKDKFPILPDYRSTLQSENASGTSDRGKYRRFRTNDCRPISERTFPLFSAIVRVRRKKSNLPSAALK